MMYETRKRKNNKKRGKKKHRLLRFFIGVIVVLLVLYFGAQGLVGTQSNADGWVHTLLLGLDDDGTSSRTDVMMLASCNKDGRVKLISLQRDTLLSMGDYGTHKLNAAVNVGGIDLLKQCILYLWGVEVDYVATVDYESFQTLVDAAGGITLSITEEEALSINKSMRSRRSAIQDYSPLEELTTYGDNIHLNGEQALGYCRIRHIDSDYMRTSRQRKVLSAIFDSLRANPLRLFPFGTQALSAVETDMPSYLAVALGIDVVLTGGELSMYRLPADGTFDSGMQDGVWSIRPYVEDNRDMMRRILAE